MKSDAGKTPARRDQHLRVMRYLLSIIGVWPIQTENNTVRAIYNGYYTVFFGYLACFEVMQITRVIILITQQSWEEIAVNLGVVLTYTLALFKIYFLNSPSMQKLIKEIQRKEEEILSGDDEEVKKIYKEYARQAQISGEVFNKANQTQGFTFFCMGTACISMYIISPLLYNFVLPQPESHGINVPQPKRLIFSAYLPFDSNQHYILAYLIHLGGAFTGYSYTVHSSAMFFTIFIFCTGQIRILQHYVRYLYEYTIKFKAESEREITKDNAESVVTIRCILYHNEIIGFVDHIDRTLSTYMLLEFLVVSLKISLLILQILRNPGLEFDTFTVASYVVTMLMELFYLHWNANEIIYESSEGFVEAVFYGNWYELGIDTQKRLIFMMLRAKTPCKISIGPFYVMCINAMLSILRACYYYVCLIRQQSE